MENQNSSLNQGSSFNMNTEPMAGSVAQPFGVPTTINNGAYTEGEIYQPSGRYEASGLPMMIIGAVLSGIGVGILYHFVSQFFDLIFVFPAIAGGCVGALIGLGVKGGKVRSPKLAGKMGIIGAILVWSVMQLAGAYSIRSEMVEEFTKASIPATVAGADGKPHKPIGAEYTAIEKAVRGDIEAELSPVKTLLIYEEIRGEAGSSISHHGSGGIKLTGIWFWLLEGFETLVILGVAWGVASGAASEPFCENCDVWHKKQDLLKVHPSQNPILWEKIQTRDWKGLMQTPVGPKTDSKNLTTISLTRCPKCDCGTIGATSAGGTVADGIQHMQLAPETSRTLVAAAAAPVASSG